MSSSGNFQNWVCGSNYEILFSWNPVCGSVTSHFQDFHLCLEQTCILGTLASTGSRVPLSSEKLPLPGPVVHRTPGETSFSLLFVSWRNVTINFSVTSLQNLISSQRNNCVNRSYWKRVFWRVLCQLDSSYSQSRLKKGNINWETDSIQAACKTVGHFLY